MTANGNLIDELKEIKKQHPFSGDWKMIFEAIDKLTPPSMTANLIDEIEKYIPKSMALYDKELLLDSIKIILDEHKFTPPTSPVVKDSQPKEVEIKKFIDGKGIYRCGRCECGRGVYVDAGYCYGCGAKIKWIA